MPTLSTTLDPRSSSYLERRQAMLARLDELDETLAAARTRVRARERVELLLDRDAPFLELRTVTGSALVGGLGQVEGVHCVVVADEPGTIEGTGDRAKAYRLAGLAAENGLPLIHLAEPGRAHPERRRVPAVVAVLFGGGTAPSADYTVAVRPAAAEADFLAEDERDAIRLARLCLRRLDRPAPVPPPGLAEPPKYDLDDLVGTADVREVLARVLDGSEFEEFQPRSGTDLLAGWGAVYGYPVGVLSGGPGDLKAARFAELVRDSGTPLICLGSAPVPTPDLAVTLTPGDPAYRARLLLAWPYPGASAEADAVIDPRDTRTALGIALATVARRCA